MGSRFAKLFFKNNVFELPINENSNSRGKVPKQKKSMNKKLSVIDDAFTALASAIYTIPHGRSPFTIPERKVPPGLNNHLDIIRTKGCTARL